jgi:MFS family permease
MRTRLPPPKQARALFDWAALKELPFFTCCLAFFFSFIGLYFPIFYLPSYFNFSLHYTKNGLDFYILAILNAVSALGRITPGLLADRIGPVNTIAPVVFLTAVLSFAWMGIHNVAGTIVFACLYGFASGALLSLPPTVIARMSPNMGVVGTRMGMSFTFSGLGALIGNPIGGALLNLDEGQFWKGQLFCAIMLLVGFGFFVILRLLKWREGVKGAI